MRVLRHRLALTAVIAAVTLPAATAVAQGPPPPTAVTGKPVTVVASGVTTPTSFAFHDATIFAGSGPDESNSGGPAGLFTLAGGKATKVPGSPMFVAGMAWHGDKLYVSTFTKIVAYGGWNGTRFASAKTIAKPLKVTYNGLAFGPDGRLYAGVSFRDKYDPGRDPARYAQSIISMTASGKDVRSVATGLRQPFQLYFPAGAHHPYSGVLGQDKAPFPLDAIVIARSGQKYGYPSCLYGVASHPCRTYAKPLVLLPKHASPMGLTSVGSTLYVALFGGLGKGPVVASLPVKGGTPKPFLTGFAAPVIALAQNAGTIYVGDLTGTIYSVPA